MKYVCINTRLFPAQCFVPDVCACLRRSGTLAFLCCLLLEHGNCQEYQCASSQFNESHLWHICTFIPLQGEIPLPKQSLRRVKGCGSAVLQILIVYPRWLQINSINPFRTCWLLKAFCIYDFCNVSMLQVLALLLEEGVQEKGCVWNVRASCLGQETLWHVKGISQTWVHRMINSAANLSTNCIHTIILKDYWTIHLRLFCELSMKLNSLAADTSSSFFWGIFWMVLQNQAL